MGVYGVVVGRTFGQKIGKPLVWDQVSVNTNMSLATGFYVAWSSEVMYRGITILEGSGRMLAVPTKEWGNSWISDQGKGESPGPL